MTTQATVRERPILMNGPMVLAILAGEKTMTRRVIKPQPAHSCLYAMNGAGTHALHLGIEGFGTDRQVYVPPTPRSIDHRLPCPYGVPSDRLWVRERFYVAEPYSWGTDPSGEAIEIRGVPRGPIHYAADGPPANTPNSHYPNGLRGGSISAPDPYAIWKPHPSIFLPRWASRITLEITEVRAERLQDITEDDVQAEGCYGSPFGKKADAMLFPTLWDSINGKRPGCSWASNPWVWALSFRRLEANP